MTSSRPREADHTDLGFGTQIATGRGDRLLRRDGTFAVRRRGLGWRAALSLYHRLLTMRWPVFVALAALAFLALHVTFATAYLAAGEDALAGREPGFRRAFFFSVHTFSGIGYGHIVPASLTADWIATFEAWTGLFGLALITGLTFARFSRPTADLVYSRTAVVAPYDKGGAGRGLMLRVANQRQNQLLDLSAQMLLSVVEHRGGKTKRRFEPLELERSHISLFPLTWTLVHPISAASPLAGQDAASLRAVDAELLVLLSGLDETFSQAVHSRTSYKAGEIVWGERFADIFERDAAGNPVAVDVHRIHDTEPAP